MPFRECDDGDDDRAENNGMYGQWKAIYNGELMRAGNDDI